MADITRVVLGSSTNGKGIEISGTLTGTANTIHTAHATSLDEVWLWANNNDTSAVRLTIEWGGTASTDDHLVRDIAAIGNGPQLVIAGLTLTNSLLVKAFAGTTDKISVFGHVNRVS